MCFNITDVNAKSCTCYYEHVTIREVNGEPKEYYREQYIEVGENGELKKCRKTTDEFARGVSIPSSKRSSCIEENRTITDQMKKEFKNAFDNNCSLESCNKISYKYKNYKAIEYGEFEENYIDNFYTPNQQIGEDDEAKDLTNEADLEEIKEWGKEEYESLYEKNEGADCSIIDDELRELLNKALIFLSIAGIIILIVMSMIEFIKALTGANDDLIKTAFKHTIVRVICAIILLLTPMLVSTIIGVINDLREPQVDKEGNVILDENGDPLCGIYGSLEG